MNNEEVDDSFYDGFLTLKDDRHTTSSLYKNSARLKLLSLLHYLWYEKDR